MSRRSRRRRTDGEEQLSWPLHSSEELCCLAGAPEAEHCCGETSRSQHGLHFIAQCATLCNESQGTSYNAASCQERVNPLPERGRRFLRAFFVVRHRCNRNLQERSAGETKEVHLAKPVTLDFEHRLLLPCIRHKTKKGVRILKHAPRVKE